MCYVYGATPKEARHSWNLTAAGENLAAASNRAGNDSVLAHRLAAKSAYQLVRERFVSAIRNCGYQIGVAFARVRSARRMYGKADYITWNLVPRVG